MCGEKGSADAERDPRGFALKFYTEDGNYDLVGNNTPVFFIRDPLKFPDFIHTQKRNPGSNLKDPNMFWDFLSLTPESLHQVTILFSDRGTPRSFRNMNGFGSHTFKWYNDDGEIFWVKYHFKTDQGIQNLTREEAEHIKGADPDHATRDLHDAIKKGEFPSWTLQMQIMPAKEAENYRFDVFDVTEVWPHGDYPPMDIGKMVLNRNPSNYFAEVNRQRFLQGTSCQASELHLTRCFKGVFLHMMTLTVIAWDPTSHYCQLTNLKVLKSKTINVMDTCVLMETKATHQTITPTALVDRNLTSKLQNQNLQYQAKLRVNHTHTQTMTLYN